MFTSNYWNYTGPGCIAISRGIPRNIPAGFRIYRALAPGAWFSQEPYCSDEALYRQRYFDEILKLLNAARVYEQLRTLAGDHAPVLLCWEHLDKEGQWCHRRMAAEWFEAELGISVPEYKPASA
jgi:hypothetical protein